jgi:hypothetical protein
VHWQLIPQAEKTPHFQAVLNCVYPTDVRANKSVAEKAIYSQKSTVFDPKKQKIVKDSFQSSFQPMQLSTAPLSAIAQLPTSQI